MGGSPPAGPTPETTEQILGAYTKYLPALTEAAIGQIGPTEQALLDASQKYTPQYTKAQLDLYKEYGPMLNEIANQIEAQNVSSRLGTETAALQGQAPEWANAALDVAKILDPEYYSTRAASSGKLQELLGSYDLGGLTGAESANVERGVNRVFGDQAPSSTQAAKAATMFDERLQAKKSNLAQALQLVPQNLAASRSGFDPLASIGKSMYTPNQGQSQQIGYQAPNVGSMASNVAGQAMGAATDMSQSRNQMASSVFGSRMSKWQNALSQLKDVPILGLLT